VYPIAIPALLFAFLASANNNLVTYHDDRLTVDFVNSPLPDAMAEITRETGINFSIPVALKNSVVTERFTDLPLINAIQRLLKNYNHIISYNHSGSGQKPLERVILLDRSRQRDFSFKTDAESVLNAQQPNAILYRQPSGHYLANGMINDYPVTFLIDTGATLVTIPGELADRAGLEYGSAKTVNTANGQGQGYITTLESIAVEGILLQQVKAVILPDMREVKQVLLGMSFLEAFELIQKNDTLTIRQQH
jgi:aspartyl protease family protein